MFESPPHFPRDFYTRRVPRPHIVKTSEGWFIFWPGWYTPTPQQLERVRPYMCWLNGASIAAGTSSLHRPHGTLQ